MWFIGVKVEQETSAPPPKKNPGSAPGLTPWRSANFNRLFETSQSIKTFAGSTYGFSFVVGVRLDSLSARATASKQKMQNIVRATVRSSCDC